MQPDPVRVEVTSAWLKKSRKDLWRADPICLGVPVPGESKPPTVEQARGGFLPLISGHNLR